MAKATDLAQLDAVTRQIATLTEIGRQIRECGDLREIKRHKDVMEQLRLLAKRLGAGIDIQNAAWKETFQSRRALGQMLIEMRANGQRSRAGRPKKNDCRDGNHLPYLADLGLNGQESSRSQALAHIPDQTAANAIAAIEKNGGELVTRQFVDLGHWWKQRQEEAEAEAAAAEAAAAEAEEEEQEEQEEEEAEAEAEETTEAEAEPEVDQAAEETLAKAERAAAIRRGQQAWEGILQGYFRVVNSIREMGGADVLVAGWEPSAIREFVSTFDLVIGKLGEIRDQMRRIADEGN